ncbi:radical SAM protein [Candidatus Pacearchaeota archaeon]|nr:radical SAM protein [Candidatus Pacearchaeota archaeon]
MKIAIISMGKSEDKFPMLEHCCYGYSKKKMFHAEIVLFYFALKKAGLSPEFFDGNLTGEEEILKKLEKNLPEKIIYYVYTPSIREKTNFMKKLSKISKLYLVIAPFFWKEKILKEFPFVEDVFYDGEKGMKISVEDSEINYEEIDINPYLTEAPFPIVVSKYCPYQCTYCNARKTGLMDRNLDVIKKELKYLKKRGVKRIRLCGNNLNINEDRFLKICEMMKELQLEWSGDGRIDRMTDRMYSALKESKGVLLFGVESATQEVLDKMDKRLTIQQIIDNAKKFNEMKIPFRYTFMFGFPWDSHETSKDMVDLKKKVGALNYHCNFLAAYPGTPIFEEMKKLNLVNEAELNFEDFSSSKLPLAPTLHLTKEEVSELVKKIMISGALSKSVIKNLLKTRKVTEYPKIISRGLKLVLYGKRTWKE